MNFRQSNAQCGAHSGMKESKPPSFDLNFKYRVHSHRAGALVNLPGTLRLEFVDYVLKEADHALRCDVDRRNLT